MSSKTIASIELLAGERQPNETDKAVVACNDWLRLGVGRTLPELLSKYSKMQQNKAPTTSLNTLQQWSMKFAWAERAKLYDSTWEERKNAERRAVFDQGLALDFERVRKLISLADFLEGQIYEQIDGKYVNLWVEDVKGIGSREDFERVEIERFNPALLEQYRRTLDDIAKEVGGRIQKQEHTGVNGEPLKVVITYASDHANR